MGRGRHGAGPGEGTRATGSREDGADAAADRPEEGAWTAARVAALRARLGLSQAAFARLLGVRQQTVSEWETARYRPRGASARLLGLLAEERAPYTPGPPETPGAPGR
jgi:DNA-binding transcriptional regulator YiaG